MRKKLLERQYHEHLQKLVRFALLSVSVSLSLLCDKAPSHAETNDGAISYDAATKTETIQGDCDADQIRAYMTGTASQAETLHFVSTPTITIKQVDTGPFDHCASLKYIRRVAHAVLARSASCLS